MRWGVLVLALFVSSCDEEAYYADGMPWVPVEQRESVDVPLQPPPIPLGQMDARQQATYFAQAGIQADQRVRTFTPTWTGFSVDPVGDINYMDFGAIVMMWVDADLQGTSSQNFMTITNLPSSIRPAGTRLVHCGALRDGVGTFTLSGQVSVLANGQVHFALDDTATSAGLVVANPNFWTASGTKGLKNGWLITYAK